MLNELAQLLHIFIQGCFADAFETQLERDEGSALTKKEL